MIRFHCLVRGAPALVKLESLLLEVEADETRIHTNTISCDLLKRTLVSFP